MNILPEVSDFRAGRIGFSAASAKIQKLPAKFFWLPPADVRVKPHKGLRIVRGSHAHDR